MDLINASLKTLSAALEAREISSVELTQFFLDRIERLNPKINAFITTSAEHSLAEAWAADARISAEKNVTPLTGIPVAHKDLFCTTGIRTTCGSRMLENFVAPYDATVVNRLKAAGMVTLGKTNMDEFAMGSSNETSYFGPVRNPWQPECVSGGSSGGSAAAVAARMAPVATGSDTGGSIRQPAAFCGLTGLKPTYGLVSRWGMIAYASSLDQGGPMAKTAEDCALLLNAMVGFDEKDSTSLMRPVEDYTLRLNEPLNGKRIGLPREFFTSDLSEAMGESIQTAIEVFRKLGAEIVEVSLPNMKLSIPVYYVIGPAEASSNLARFDGVRYGYRAPEYDDLYDMFCKSRAQGFGAEVKRRIMIGTYVLSHGYYDAYYLKAQRVRRLISNDFAEAFKQCDILLGPTTPTPAFRIGEKTADPVQMYLSDMFTIAVNLAGIPGMSIFCGLIDGMPAGLQLIGNYFAEGRLLNAAHQYQLATGWDEAMPKEIE